VRGRRTASRSDPGDAIVDDDERLVGPDAGAPLPRAVTRDQLADVGDQRAHARPPATEDRVMTRWTSRAATRAVRPSTSSRGLSSLTSRWTSLPLSTTASHTAWQTKGGTPSAAGALTPGAVA